MSQTSTRHTLFALLSSMEEDLRRILHELLSHELPPTEVLGESLWSKTTERLQAESERDLQTDELLRRLPFLDFGDLIGLLNKHRSRLPKPVSGEVRKQTPVLETAIPIRNRVMHTRPLEVDDLERVLTVKRQLLQAKNLHWTNLAEVSERIDKNPGWELGVVLPLPDPIEDRAGHNLPLPEFDETGFVGREDYVSMVLSQCLGTFPIITIVGEGGVGKTALALKVAYDLLDHDQLPFESIVWTSAKAAALTATEVQRIDGAIKDSTGLLRSAAYELAGTRFEDAEEEILAYLQEFKVLLILDNLETVLDEQVHRFLGRLPPGSKVLITSRIGLGELEFRVRLDPLGQDEAVRLLRAVASVRGVNEIVRMPNKALAGYCSKMRFNPGHIKWFVSAVQAGSRPEEVLASPDVFLRFCMDNVYSYLSEDSRATLDAILCVPEEHTQPELAFLTDMDIPRLQSSLQELLRTNLLTLRSEPQGSSYSSRYALSEQAREYLQREHPVSKTAIEAVTKRRRQLVALGESTKAHSGERIYDMRRVSVRSRTDRVLAKYLIGALSAIRRKDFEVAEENLGRARQLGPSFFEVHRVEAYLRFCQENYTAARAAYESAIELEPEYAPLRNWYAGFLMRAFDDLEGALKQYEKARELDPDTPDNEVGLARVLLYLGKHSRARKRLNAVLSRMTDLAPKTRRVATDLLLQTYRREADHRLENRDAHGALKALQNLRNEYEKIDPDLRDLRMRRGLEKPIHAALQCARLLDDRGKKATARDIALWLEGVSQEGLVSRKLEGTVKKVLASKGYGFIRTDDGTDIFFHRRDVLPEQDFDNLREGDPVLYSVRQDVKGPCAVRVRRDLLS